MKCLLVALAFFLGCAPEIHRPDLYLFDQDISIENLPRDQASWTNLGKRIQNFGTGRSPLWLRTNLQNTTSETKDFILEVGVAYLDEILFYIQQKESITSGSMGVFTNSVSEKIVFHRHPSIQLSLAPNETAVIYFKIKNSGLLAFPVRILEKTEFVNKTQAEYIIHGLYFGAMLSMLFYNLLIFITIREKSFLFYCLYISCVIYVYLVLGGFQKQFFSPNHSFFIKPGLFISSYLTIAFVLLFTSEFLNLRKISIRFERTLKLFAYTCLFLAFVSPFLPFSMMVRSMNYLLPFGSSMMIAAAFLGFKKGIRQSSFFLGAWIIVTVGVVLETLTNLNYFPMEFWLGRFGTQLSSLLEGILFSIAIGRRIRSLTREKEIVNSKLLLIEKDLEVARKIQNRILPLRYPLLKGAKINVTYLPLRAVGGDFYDFHEQDEKHFGVLVADVTGHGVSAAMDSSTVKIAFNYEKQWLNQPEKLLESMNQFLVDSLDQRFVSASYAYFDLENHNMLFATAGHPPILLLRGDQMIPLESEGFLLGFLKDCSYTLYSRKLNSGDKLLFYTDGLCDDISSEKTPIEVLMETIRTLKFETGEQFTSELVKKLKLQRTKESDDITALLIEIRD